MLGCPSLTMTCQCFFFLWFMNTKFYLTLYRLPFGLFLGEARKLDPSSFLLYLLGDLGSEP